MAEEETPEQKSLDLIGKMIKDYLELKSVTALFVDAMERIYSEAPDSDAKSAMRILIDNEIFKEMKNKAKN